MQVLKALSEVSTIIAGQSPPSDTYNVEGFGLPFFQGKTDFGDLYPKIRVYCANPQKIAEKNDILLSVRAPVGPTNLAPSKVCIGRGLTAVRAGENLNQKYLLFFFRSIEKVLSDSGTGTTFKAITQEQIRNIKIPLPSLPEQERIVARIEELFSELDKGVEALQTIKAQLKVYRQAVLKEAFEGDFPLIKLDEISFAFGGYAFQSKDYDPVGTYTIVKIGNVKGGRLDISTDCTHISNVDNKTIEKYLLQDDDCLISMTGTRNKRDYGYVSIVKDCQNCLLNQRVSAIRFKKTKAFPSFYLYYLASPSFRDQFFSYETGNVGQGNVGMKAITDSQVILPSLERQKLIVNAIESRLSVCDKIEQTVNESLAKAESLRQSILKKAFEGRL